MSGDVVNEGYSQVAAAGTGDKIRNLTMDVVQPDGTTATVKMQVVSIVDEDGAFVGSSVDLLKEMLRLQERTNDLLELTLEAVG